MTCCNKLDVLAGWLTGLHWLACKCASQYSIYFSNKNRRIAKKPAVQFARKLRAAAT